MQLRSRRATLRSAPVPMPAPYWRAVSASPCNFFASLRAAPANPGEITACKDAARPLLHHRSMKAAMPAVGIKVRDVMTEAVMFLNAGQSQDEAWEHLRAHEVSGAPVLGRGGKLVGVVTRADLADPRRRAPATAATVADAMTRVIYAVRASDPVMHAVRLMLKEHIHRALVVHDDGSIAGIVAPTDILKALTRGLELRDESTADTPIEFVDLRKFA